MKKLKFSLFGIMILSTSFAYVINVNAQQDRWKAAGNGPFNEVRAVCIPHYVAQYGADKSMRSAGVNQKIEVTKAREQWSCYVKFFYNPAKPPYARQQCGTRKRYDRNEFDYVYSSLSQFACGVQFLAPEKIADQVKNPLRYAVEMYNLNDALNYIQTGETAEDRLPRAISYSDNNIE